jgi:uncharacterized membrane protein YheB (UPF0754 family)
MLIYTLPFIAAAIGWLTNWIAVKMLFRPKLPVKILGITFHGIFPKNQARIAERIGRMIADELLSVDDVKKHVNSPEQMRYIRRMIEAKIEEYLYQTFPKRHPLTALVFGEKRRDAIKGELMQEADMAAPEIVNNYLAAVEEDFDVADIIRKRVELLDVDRLEQLMMSILDKEFQFIEMIGAVIGFLIGLVQVVITLL